MNSYRLWLGVRLECGDEGLVEMMCILSITKETSSGNCILAYQSASLISLGRVWAQIGNIMSTE